MMNMHLRETADASPELASDLIWGAKAIAKFIYGKDDKKHQRKVFYLAERSRVPISRIGSRLCARKSTLLAWITEQEKRGWNGPSPRAGDKAEVAQADARP